MSDFVKGNIIASLGLGKLPEKEQEEILEKIGDIVFKAVLIRVFDGLSEDGQKELDEFLQKEPENADALYEFLKSKVPNLDDMVLEEIDAFRADAGEVMGEGE